MKPDKISKSDLDALQAASIELNALDSAIAERLIQIETSIRGVVSTRISTRFNETTKLVYGKIDGDWHLILETEGKPTKLLSCARQMRYEVISGGHIPRLLTDAVAQLRAQINDRLLALAIANELVSVVAIDLREVVEPK